MKDCSCARAERTERQESDEGAADCLECTEAAGSEDRGTEETGYSQPPGVEEETAKEVCGAADSRIPERDPSLEAETPLLRPDGSVRLRYLAWALISLAGISAFIWLLMAVQTVSIPFLIAFILAYILDPVVDWFEEKGVSRTLGICVILVGTLFGGALFALVVGPKILAELAALPDKLHLLTLQLVPWVEGRFDVTLPRTFGDAVSELERWLGSFEMTAITASTVDVMRALMGGTASALAIVAAVLLVPVFSFFLLRDFDRIMDAAKDLLPQRYRPQVLDRMREIDLAMSGFIRGQLTVAGILAVLYTAGLWAIGLPMAFLVGVIAGLGNMVPYVGTAVGLVLATAVALLDWQGFGFLLLVYGVFAVVQLLESWVFTPRIVGESVGLSPFLVIVAVLVFGDLFGFVGVLIAVPLAAIVKILLRVFLEQYRASPFFRT